MDSAAFVGLSPDVGYRPETGPGARRFADWTDPGATVAAIRGA